MYTFFLLSIVFQFIMQTIEYISAITTERMDKILAQWGTISETGLDKIPSKCRHVSSVGRIWLMKPAHD